MADATAAEYKIIHGARVRMPVDLPEDILLHAIECARNNLSGIKDWHTEGDAAVQRMKDEFDTKYGAYWHVVVGKHFGSKVTHDSGNFAFFYLGDKAVLIFKSG